MKTTLIAAAALAVSAAFIPAPAKAAEASIGIKACSHVKAGMPADRAVRLAINSDPSSMAQIRATGANPTEAAQMIFGVMQTMCGDYIRSAEPSKPKISKDELAKIQLRRRNEQLIAARAECSNKLNAVAPAQRLNVLMSECK